MDRNQLFVLKGASEGGSLEASEDRPEASGNRVGSFRRPIGNFLQRAGSFRRPTGSFRQRVGSFRRPRWNERVKRRLPRGRGFLAVEKRGRERRGSLPSWQVSDVPRTQPRQTSLLPLSSSCFFSFNQESTVSMVFVGDFN